MVIFNLVDHMIDNYTWTVQQWVATISEILRAYLCNGLLIGT